MATVATQYVWPESACHSTRIHSVALITALMGFAYCGGCAVRRFRDRAADTIMPQEFEQHLAQTAEDRDWALATVNRYRALISLVFRLGIDSGKVKGNPARLVKHRQENNARVRWLSAEEEVRLRAVLSATCSEHIPELDLALNTGLRLSELYGLDWANVNISRRVLTVPRPKKWRDAPCSSKWSRVSGTGGSRNAYWRNWPSNSECRRRAVVEPALLV